MTLSPAALKFLAWIRDNEHHSSGWVEAVGETRPDNWNHMRVSGEHASIKIHKDVASEVSEYFEPVSHTEFCECNRMYRPNAAGLKALQEARI